MPVEFLAIKSDDLFYSILSLIYVANPSGILLQETSKNFKFLFPFNPSNKYYAPFSPISFHFKFKDYNDVFCFNI